MPAEDPPGDRRGNGPAGGFRGGVPCRGDDQEAGAPLETAENRTPDDPQTEGDSTAAEAQADGVQPETSAAKTSGPPLTKWREIWPVPLLGVGAALLASGVYMALSTAPDPVFAPAFDDASRLIEAGAYDEAIDELNTRVYPYVGRPALDREGEGRYRVLLARALYGGQTALEFPQPVNDENIVDQYRRAEELLGGLEAGDVRKLARTLIRQGELETAKRRAGTLTDSGERIALYREVIDAARAQARPDYATLLNDVDTYLGFDGLSEEGRIWGLARRAEAQIELDYTGEAINGLLRELPLLVGRDLPGVGELYVLLGRGYLESGAPRDAIDELRTADTDAMLPPGDPARPLARLYLARAIEESAEGDDDMRAARDLYESLAFNAARPEIRLPAMFGLVRTEAALDDHAAAFEAFAGLDSAMRERGAPPRPDAETVAGSLIGVAERHESSWLAGGDTTGVGLMLRYAEAAAGLFSIASMPTELLDVLSRAHEATARAALGFGPETTGQRLGLDDLRAFDPSTLRQAKRHLIQSASFARLHADRFLINDYDTYADSLWRSALLSDAAGDRSQAIEGLTLFAETVQNDPRQPEARHRLGELFRARGEYKTAAGYYAGLIDESRSGDAARIGRWADLSFVPLAQCYIADVDDSNDQEAVRLLEQSIDGTRGGPERPEFREAVIELGNLAMRRSQYADAIERYEEAVARSDGDTPLVGVRFRLADAYRLLAEEIENRLDEPLSDRERGILSAERSSHLRSAIEHFGVVRDELGRLDPRTMTELQSVYLRNAHFYLGDCAFDLEQYREAIDYYDRAKSRYSGDPAVLVAMIQTVNAYIALGDYTSARTANDRAKATYQTLPDDVWDDPNLPMSRREWESWLDANTRLITGYAKGG